MKTKQNGSSVQDQMEKYSVIKAFQTSLLSSLDGDGERVSLSFYLSRYTQSHAQLTLKGNSGPEDG